MQGRLDLAGGLAVIGAIALLAGLWLDWYEPGISAWTAFEIVDLLLAAIAVSVVFVALARSPRRPRVEAVAGWLPIAALAALVLVVAALVNPPPAAIDRPLEIGAWVSLGGAILLVVAAILSTTELSVVVTMRPRTSRRSTHEEEAAEPDWDPPEEPLDESPTDESPIEEPPVDESPIEEPPIEDPDYGLAEPVDEGIVPAADLEPDDYLEPDDETKPLPRRRPR
jgi:hypothetical protein